MSYYSVLKRTKDLTDLNIKKVNKIEKECLYGVEVGWDNLNVVVKVRDQTGENKPKKLDVITSYIVKSRNEDPSLEVITPQFSSFAEFKASDGFERIVPSIKDYQLMEKVTLKYIHSDLKFYMPCFNECEEYEIPSEVIIEANRSTVPLSLEYVKSMKFLLK